jgi:hypothetical protein
MDVVYGLMLAALAAQPASEAAQDGPPPSLRGSPAAMVQQHAVAEEHDLSFYQTVADIQAAVDRGELVELAGNADYEVADFVTLRYARPEVRLFVERTAALYRQACGEPLVVTSLVRPVAEQPPNAHALSVHPAGMAVDLRVSAQEPCRQWLESKMLELEEQRLINGIREFRPPHYHVAVFPEPYMAYAEAQRALEPERTRALDVAEPPADPSNTRWGLVVAFLVLGLGVGIMVWHLRRSR